MTTERLPHAEAWPVISSDQEVQDHYEECRANGCTHTLAELLALGPKGHLPSLMTDAVFLESHCNGNQFEKTPHLGEFYKHQAKAAGVNTHGAVYLSGLAEYPGDPKAWVRGRGDVEAVLKERGWSGEGAVNVKAPAPIAATKEIAVGEDIIRDEVSKRLASHPEPQTVDVGELAHQVREERKPHWAD